MSECPVLLSRVLFCQRLVWLVNISSNPQRTCPSEERPQTCYCSDYMSIKHLLIEREREQKEGKRGGGGESGAWADKTGWVESKRRAARAKR